MPKSKSNITNRGVLAFILILLIDLTFLFYLKYRNQNLGLDEFSLFNFGNLLNIFSFLLIAVALVIVLLKKQPINKIKLVWLLILVLQLNLIIAYFVADFELPFDKYYLLGQPGNRLFIGLVYTLYQFTLFTIMFLIWLTLFQTKNLLILRSLLNSVLLMFAILIFSFVFIIMKENQFDQKLIKNKNDNVAVVLGAAVWSGNKPSPSLAARVDRALDLLDSGSVNTIYLTGSNAPGELAESEVALKYIKSKKGQVENVFIEKNTTSTNEQIRFIKNNLLLDGNKKNIIIVSDGYHLVRIIEISKFHNIMVQAVPSNLSLNFEKAVYFKFREALALIVFWFFAY